MEKEIKTLKPLAVKWILESWKKLTLKQSMIEKGWDKIGFKKLLDLKVQLEAMQMAVKKKLSIDPEEENNEWDEDAQEEEEEVEEEEDDADVETALAACLSKACTVGERRSERISQKGAAR